MKMMNSRMQKPPRSISISTVLVALVLVILLAALVVTYKRWEGHAPEAAFDRDFKALGRAPSVGLTVQDSGTGLRHVTILLKTKDQSLVLADDSFDRPGAEKSKTYDVGKLIAEKYAIRDGPATLDISVSDYALRNFLRGNRTLLSKDFEFDIKPPQLEVLSGQHYINQGGSEFVVYRVSDDAEV